MKLLKWLLNKFSKKAFISKNYWDNRYKNGNNSGAGSYGRLAEFKAAIINDFVNRNQIKTVIEFGTGDGNQLLLFNFENYIGFDVSKTVLKKLTQKFTLDNTKIFKHIDEYNNDKADLVLSLDVLYHLIEDSVFHNYMLNLFNSSDKYVIIYSSNKDEATKDVHVRHRKFTDWIENHQKKFYLIEHIKNIWPFDENDKNNTSFADFYIFKKAD